MARLGHGQLRSVISVPRGRPEANTAFSAAAAKAVTVDRFAKKQAMVSHVAFAIRHHRNDFPLRLGGGNRDGGEGLKHPNYEFAMERPPQYQGRLEVASKN